MYILFLEGTSVLIQCDQPVEETRTSSKMSHDGMSREEYEEYQKQVVEEK